MSLSPRHRSVTPARPSRPPRPPATSSAGARRVVDVGETLMGMGVAGRLAAAAGLSVLVWSAIALGLA